MTMHPISAVEHGPSNPPLPINVWDLPTRLFHWALAGLVFTSLVTGHWGGNAMQYHVWSGYAILTLVLFRILWGFIGSRTSRFSSFLCGPSAVWQYAKSLFGHAHVDTLGHNPLGGWSIAAMLLTLLFQAAAGLFSDDGIATQGPLAHLVSNATSSLITELHRLNQLLITLLVIVHIAAIFYYAWIKGTNLIGPMITGIKTWHGERPLQNLTGPSWPAVVAAAFAIGAVYLLVN